MLQIGYFGSIVRVVTSSHGSSALDGGKGTSPLVYSVFLQFESPTAATSLLLEGSAYFSLPLVASPLFWIGAKKRAVPGPPVPGLGVNEPLARASANVV